MAAQTRITSMSIDSRFADQTYGTTADFMIRLPSTMRNVSQIILSSVELPEVVYVFSYGNTVFTVQYGGISYICSILPGNYTATALATAVTAAMTGAGIGATCQYNSTTNRFVFGSTSGTVHYALLLWDPDKPLISSRTRDWGLGYNMGFRVGPPVPIDVNPTATAPSSPQIFPPAYMLLQLRCPDMLENTIHRVSDGAFVPALAKIILRQGAYVINFDDWANLLRKENVFQQPTALSQFRITLVDAYGAIVHMGDTDWSMTFEITEIVNSCKYNELNAAYGRC